MLENRHTEERLEHRWTDFKCQFRNATKKAKIDDFRFHDTRHTLASHLVTSGVDIRTVHELLGHQSLAMTKRYSHLAPVHRMRAVQILDTAYQIDTVENQAAGES